VAPSSTRDQALALAGEQAGVIARRQLLALGLTPAQARAAVEAGRWQRLLPGAYLTHTGPAPEPARLWAAVLAAGAGAVVGPPGTLWLKGLLPDLPPTIEVWVPHRRHVQGAVGLRLRRSRTLALAAHPVARPPQLRLERAVLEAVRQIPRTEQAVDLLICAVQQRRTTAERLLAELATYRAHPSRAMICDVLAEVRDGVRSQLERRWLLRVERPHDLPRGLLNVAEPTADGVRYRDVSYPRWHLVCELDGREAHPGEQAFRDRARDNRVAVGGRYTLRYGWREVAGDPCGVALEVASVLHRNGWSGRPVACGPGCPIRVAHGWIRSSPAAGSTPRAGDRYRSICEDTSGRVRRTEPRSGHPT
jgi:hypothetical protein